MVSVILDDLPVSKGEEVAVLVNGMGATPLAELLIVFRAVHRLLSGLGIAICRSFVGNFVTSLEMAGCSITALPSHAGIKGATAGSGGHAGICAEVGHDGDTRGSRYQVLFDPCRPQGWP